MLSLWVVFHFSKARFKQNDRRLREESLGELKAMVPLSEWTAKTEQRWGWGTLNSLCSLQWDYCIFIIIIKPWQEAPVTHLPDVRLFSHAAILKPGWQLHPEEQFWQCCIKLFPTWNLQLCMYRLMAIHSLPFSPSVFFSYRHVISFNKIKLRTFSAQRSQGNNNRWIRVKGIRQTEDRLTSF